MHDESIVAIAIVGIKIVMDANGEERSSAERDGLMGDKYTDGVNSMKRHPNVKLLPFFFVLEI